MQKKARWEPEDLDWVFKETSHIDQDLIRQVFSDHFDSSECDADMENDEIIMMILLNLGTAQKSGKAMTVSSTTKFKAGPHNLRHDQKPKKKSPCEDHQAIAY